MSTLVDSTVAQKEWFDIVIVVPLEEELTVLLEVFPATVNRSTDRIFRHQVEVGRDDIKVLIVQQEGMGALMLRELFQKLCWNLTWGWLSAWASPVTQLVT